MSLKNNDSKAVDKRLKIKCADWTDEDYVNEMDRRILSCSRSLNKIKRELDIVRDMVRELNLIFNPTKN